VIRTLRRRADDFDVINCHHALLSILLPSKRLVTTYHGYVGRLHFQLGRTVADALRRLVVRTLVQPALQRSAAATVVSASLLAQLSAERRASIRVIHNGVGRLSVEGTPGSTTTQRYFFYCGRIDRDKSVDVLVKRFAHSDVGIPLLLAGDGPLRTPLQREFGGDRIVFLGFRPREELARLYRDAVAFVTASTYESFCLPVIEAAMCGCPALAPNSGAMPEVIDHGRTGFCYSTEEDFRSRLLALVAMSVDDRRDLERRCVAWSESFVWETKRNEYLKVFCDASHATQRSERG
jgi:glycosyltransferase involved in cell wall biosynthesis